jgi:hypothetical protein
MAIGVGELLLGRPDTGELFPDDLCRRGSNTFEPMDAVSHGSELIKGRVVLSLQRVLSITRQTETLDWSPIRFMSTKHRPLLRLNLLG